MDELTAACWCALAAYQNAESPPDFPDYLSSINDLLANINPDSYGAFSVAWGPVQNNGVIFFVAQSGDGSFWVSFCGTLPNWKETAQYDIDTETGLVDFLSAGCQITQGTSLGVSMAAVPRDPNSNLTLSDFLTKSCASGGSVHFTGHSLGGALAQAMAAWWSSQFATLNYTTKVYLETFAAPNIGDSAFYNQLSTALAGYTAVVNSYDVVPMAWSNVTGILNSFAADGSTVYPLLLKQTNEQDIINLLEAAQSSEADFSGPSTSNIYSFSLPPSPVSDPTQGWADAAEECHSIQNAYLVQFADISTARLNGTEGAYGAARRMFYRDPKRLPIRADTPTTV